MTLDTTGLEGQLVTVQDKTKRGIRWATMFNWVWSLDYQARFHYGRSSWVKDGYAPAAHVLWLPKSVSVPKGAWNIVLEDVSDVEGALGYHEDASGQTQFGSRVGPSGLHSVRTAASGETPLSKVFVKTSLEDGIDPAEVASHEMLEMLVDPYVMNEDQVRKVLNKKKKEWYIVEVGDPVQGNGYDIGAPENRTPPCGVTVADFAEPSWWGMPQKTHPGDYSFRKSVSAAYEIGPLGYMSVAPESSPEEWNQIFGSEKAKAEAAAHSFEKPGQVS